MTQKNKHNLVINFFNFCIKFPGSSQTNKGKFTQKSEREDEPNQSITEVNLMPAKPQELLSDVEQMIRLIRKSPNGIANWLHAGEIFLDDEILAGNESLRLLLLAIQEYKRSSSAR